MVSLSLITVFPSVLSLLIFLMKFINMEPWMCTHRGHPLLSVAEVVGSILSVGPGAFYSDDDGDDLRVVDMVMFLLHRFVSHYQFLYDYSSFIMDIESFFDDKLEFDTTHPADKFHVIPKITGACLVDTTCGGMAPAVDDVADVGTSRGCALS